MPSGVEARVCLWRSSVRMLSHVRLCNPMDYIQPARLICPWDLPGKNTGMGFHFLLQWKYRVFNAGPPGKPLTFSVFIARLMQQTSESMHVCGPAPSTQPANG